jgi:glutathione S-transferase
MKLVIGNKRLSSWSLRPWVLMRHFDIPFEEVLIPLDQPETKSAILKYSPSGKVPALMDGEIVIFESLAIMEYLNEKFPQKRMWPSNTKDRALARSYSNEMHAGFGKMRELLSHDLQKELAHFDSSGAAVDIARVKQIWTSCLEDSDGPYLFGDFSIADAMFAPVVNRFVSYAVATEGLVKDYVKTMRSLPAHAEWIAAALKEKFSAPLHP